MAASLITAHRFLANTVSLFILAVALFALFRMIRKQPLGTEFWGAVVIGEGLIVVQALIGIVLVIMGVMPARWVHFLYGALGVILWPATFTYSSQQDERRQTVIWFAISLFMFAMLTLRSSSTGLPTG